MDKSKKIFLIVGLVIIIALIIVIIAMKRQSPITIDNTPGQPATEQSNQVKETPTTVINQSGDQFRADVPTNIQVPNVNEKLSEEQKKDTAVPTVVTPAAPGAISQFRSFNISGDQGKFFPSKIIGRVGDTIHINFTSNDQDYDIIFPSYNMKGVITKGQTKVLEFQARKEGDFTFYCERCGGPTSAATGHIIITK